MNIFVVRNVMESKQLDQYLAYLEVDFIFVVKYREAHKHRLVKYRRVVIQQIILFLTLFKINFLVTNIQKLSRRDKEHVLFPCN